MGKVRLIQRMVEMGHENSFMGLRECQEILILNPGYQVKAAIIAALIFLNYTQSCHFPCIYFP